VSSSTAVPAGDPRGRELFARAGVDGPIWIEPFLAEVNALTGVTLVAERLAAQGQVAVFSMLSRLTLPAPAPFHRPLVGRARISRDRGAFTVYETSAAVDGVTVIAGETMSGAARLADIACAPVRPFAADPGGAPVDPALFAFKHPSQRYVDRLVSCDPAERRAVCAYSYPVDHPFVAGHFPAAALMMGVTQWQAVADAAWVAKRRLGLAGTVLAEGVIRRPDGTEVLDVRELRLVEDGGWPRIAATKRVAFREPVRPGDGILIEVTLRPE
jgi:3-hydroxymyristoyl/3-hydroxydecanoyl-(acyl carrier protein) dehydratase